MATRAGSHAGRGFRYQDAVAASLVVEGFVGESEYGCVVPEGGDDLELRTVGGRTLAQVKSRRDHMGPFAPRSVAGFIKKMWDEKGLQPDDQFLLVLESNVGERRTAFRQLQDLSAHPTVVAELKRRKGAADLIARTKVLVLPDPRGSALAQISTRQACSGFEAEMYFADLLGVVGRLSDDNGMRAADAYMGLAVSDVQQRFDTLQPLLTSTLVEAALTDGLCSAVDFLTPDEDPLFYLGVDAQASHVAAGLVVERPELRSAVLSGLEGRRNALIHGISGSGKSALLWEAAYASRHTVRWFHVKRLPPNGVQALAMLARSRRASTESPVGFIIDDVGRGFSEGWTVLAAEVASNPGLLLLASVREEDRYPLADSHRATQVKVVGEDGLAERVWRELRERGQTAWQGWKEPWSLSNGHLMEYTHVLTQGRRLSETLNAQVFARMRDVSRHDELDVLRLVACANAVGCSAEVAQLPQILGKPATTVSYALTRLKDEHLMQDASPGRVVGLHELRSSALLRLTHETPPPLLSTTTSAAVWLVPTEELARFLERTLSTHEDCDEQMLEALVLRLETTPSPALFSATLTGLDRANAHRVIRLWRETPEAKLVAPSLQGTPAGLAIGDIEPPDIGPTAPATRRFTAVRAEVIATGLTARFFARLAPSCMRQVLAAATAISDLRRCLAALLGQDVPPQHLSELSKLAPPLVEGEFQEVVSLLLLAARVDRAIAIGWVDAVGQEALFERFSANVSWADLPKLAPCEEGLEVTSNVWFVATSRQNDLHTEVVQTCERLMALTPSADIVSSQAIGVDGEVIRSPAGDHPLERKRMDRAAVPTPEQVARNREWLAILHAHLANESYTAYLAAGLELLRSLISHLKTYLDATLRGKKAPTAVQGLVAVYEGSLALVAPRLQKGAGERGDSSHLRYVLSACALDLTTRFVDLPDGAPAYLGWLDTLLKNISMTLQDEPWEMLASEPPRELKELYSLVDGFRFIAGEASRRRRSPLVTHLRTTAPKGAAFHLAAQAARQYHDREFKALEARLRAEIATDERIGVHLLPEASIPVVWPPADVLITLRVPPVGQVVVIPEHWPAWRAAVDPGRRICILLLMHGYALTNNAVYGYDQLFPVHPVEETHPWCSLIGVEPAPLVTGAAFNRITNPLAELQGIGAYWDQKGRRTSDEERAYESLQVAFNEAREEWEQLDLPEDVRSAVNQVIDSALQGEFPIAHAAARLLHGEVTPTMVALIDLVNALTMADCHLAGISPTGRATGS